MENKYIKLISKYNTDHFSCKDCPAKLVNGDNNYIYIGIGNPYSNIVIIYPYYISIDVKKFNKLTDIICEAYHNKYNINPLQSIYITPVIKCFIKDIKYNIKDILLKKCGIKTISEIINHNSCNKIIFLGDSNEIEMLLPYKINTYHIKCPYMVLEDTEHKEKFINELLLII